jgi:hypothetical protein
VRGEGEVRPRGDGGAAAAALVVEDEAALVGQSREPGEEGLEVGGRAAVQADERGRRGRPQDLGVQVGAVGGGDAQGSPRRP